ANFKNFAIQGGAQGANPPSVKASGSRNLKGEAKLERTDHFLARITAEVVDVKPNGTFAIAARKFIKKDEEEQEFILTGVCRGGDFAPAIRPLASMLGKFNDRAELRELGNVANVALVSVTAVLPPRTVRNGDKIDVYVMSLGAATSLKGGRLLIMPLQGPTPDSGIFAMAQGATVLEDSTIPTHALIPGGAVMEADLPAQVIQKGRLTLILNEPAASWTTASTIAKIINDAEGTGETLAIAVDSKNIVVTLPANERDNPAGFISRVQRLPVPVLPTEARVE